ncbi:Ig-like domain-containing protein [Bacillota bacterium Meth-B3]
MNTFSRRWIALALSAALLLAPVLAVGEEGGWRANYQRLLGLLGLDEIRLASLADLDFDGTPELICAADGQLLVFAAVGRQALLSGGFPLPFEASALRLTLHRVKKGGYAWRAELQGGTPEQRVLAELRKRGRTAEIARGFAAYEVEGRRVYTVNNGMTSQQKYEKQLKAYLAAHVDQRVAPVTDPGSSAHRQFDALAAAYEAQPPIPAIKARSVVLDKKKVSAEYGDDIQLTARVTPAYATGLTWTSSDEALASVDERGIVTIFGYEGTAIITARIGDRRATCTVSVKRPKAQSVTIGADTLDLRAGGTLQLNGQAWPISADQALAWQTDNARVATVDSEGLVTGLTMGNAMISARSKNGVSASVFLTVGPSANAPAPIGIKRRAVIITGSVLPEGGSMRGDAYVFAHDGLQMRNAFAQSGFGGAGGIDTVSLLTNLPTGAEVLDGLRHALRDAGPDDVSYVYIQCHGADPATTEPDFWMAVGSNDDNSCWVSSAQLRRALDTVQGKVVVMLGCCFSGGAIGKGTAKGPSFDAFMRAFTAQRRVRKSGELAAEKYLVLCAASQTQESIFNYNNDIPEGGLQNFYGAGLFGSAVCEGTGWDLRQGVTCDWKADADGDGKVTLDELHKFTRRRVRQLYYEFGVQYEETLGYTEKGIHQVQAWPEGSDFVVFAK